MTEGPVGVVGAGTMGSGIAQCLAQAGYPVLVVEPNPVALDRARARVAESLRLAVLLRGPGKNSAISETTARIEWSADPGVLRPATFVIECVTERVELKEAVFAELDRHCAADTVLASCTSAIPVTRLGARVTHAERVIGLHFMNPAPLTEMVEVIVAPQTAPNTLERSLSLIAALDKSAIVVGDRPGFVLNRVLMLLIGAAAAGLDTDTDAETVDALFEGCLGHRMGPLRTADLIGLDNVADTIAVLRTETGDDRYRVPPQLSRLVEAGHLGRKTGRGFHVYR
ncbi:3-hydroxyacyl-CoA dehydrogenase family protein [Nocardia sp. XZ_19_369]|uniref:3-hydroxyacyl-CoA dehydrogenase family protein n=1 Tax=Nocardia sp. XZ_19_369 TaxID=2769487 RepID=UPI0035A36C95